MKLLGHNEKSSRCVFFLSILTVSSTLVIADENLAGIPRRLSASKIPACPRF
jgi:hypothetical protein